MMKMNFDKTYKEWLIELKLKIRSTQIKASVAVNSVLIEFYWDLGRMIVEKQASWGGGLLEQLSIDLKAEFPGMEGFSLTNLKYCRLFYTYTTNSPQLGDEFKKLSSPQIGDENLLLWFSKIP